MKNDHRSRIVNVIDIDKNCYKIEVPHWVFVPYALIILMVGVLIFQSSITLALRYFLVAIVIVLLVGVIKAFNKGKYRPSLIADSNGLYFPSQIAEKYYFISWAHVIAVEKASFPLNSRGLRVEIDCQCFDDAVIQIGNVSNEDGRCFIYTIPQLRDRDEVIAKLYSMRPS